MLMMLAWQAVRRAADLLPSAAQTLETESRIDRRHLQQRM